MIYHVDPAALERLLELDPLDLRVILALLSLAPSGELIDHERQLAKRAGLAGVAELRRSLDRLAHTTGPTGQPIAVRDVFRAKPRVRLNGLPWLVVPHSLRQAAAVRAPAPTTAREAPPRSLADLVAERRAQLERLHPALVKLVEAWLAHVASLESDAKLSLSVVLNQYDAVIDLAAKYGESQAQAALRGGIAGAKRTVLHPENYLRAIARREFGGEGRGPLASTTDSPKVGPNDARAGRAVIEPAPLRREDLF